MLRTLLAAVLLTALAGCDSDGFDRSGHDPLDPALLAGTWTWEKTVACGDGSTGCTETTPESEGRPETLVFASESATGATGRVEGYFNGIAVGPVGYRVDIIHGDTETRPVYYAMIVLADGATYNEAFVSDTRLVISSAAADGSETTYRRR